MVSVSTFLSRKFEYMLKLEFRHSTSFTYEGWETIELSMNFPHLSKFDWICLDDFCSLKYPANDRVSECIHAFRARKMEYWCETQIICIIDEPLWPQHQEPFTTWCWQSERKSKSSKLFFRIFKFEVGEGDEDREKRRLILEFWWGCCDPTAEQSTRKGESSEENWRKQNKKKREKGEQNSQRRVEKASVAAAEILNK